MVINSGSLMNMNNTLYVTNRDEWRTWLKKNHNSRKEVWLVYYKKHTTKPRIPYEKAVEEALCFGWIDSTVKKLDKETYAQKFTPRKANSRWSELNQKRALKMIKAGRMAEAGLAKIRKAKDNGKWSETAQVKKEFVLPPRLKKVLMRNEKAWKNFNNLAPSYKRLYAGWILSAKREETRQRRLKEAMELLEKNRKLGMK
jgi:uncharacterized protein YdeI (YjbR/CyaY-like superfamily)